MTTSSLLSIIGTEVAETDVSFVAWCSCWPSGFFLLHLKHVISLRSRLFFFYFRASMMTLVAGDYFFRPSVYSRLYSRNLFFISLTFLAGSAILSHGRADFGSLDLDSSEQGESLWLEPWVSTLEKVLWDGRWPLGQRASESQIMMLDFRPALASALNILCTISSKLIKSWSYYSILTLMQGLKPFWK